MRPQRLIVTLLASALVLLLAGCAGLPSHSTVNQGLAVDRPENPVQQLPAGPFDGEAPLQVVAGFLRAGVGIDNDHEVAREFLTPQLAKAWNPEQGVLVHAGESKFSYRASGQNLVTVTTPTVAKLDAGGHYEQMPNGANTSDTFELTKESGQWRISRLPKGFGIWLSKDNFDLLYEARAIYYVAKSNDTMVPDVRWFPEGPGLATSLARAQLDAVPTYLRGAVRSGAPPGTQLQVASVPVEGGLATVDLSGTALSADPDRRRVLWAEFFATLTQVAGVDRISLKVGDTRLSLPGAPQIPKDLREIGFRIPERNPTVALLRTGTKLQWVDPNSLQLSAGVPAPEPSQGERRPPLPHIPVGWIFLTASADADQLAAIGGDYKDLARWVRGRYRKLPRFGDDLTRPSFDEKGGLWIAGIHQRRAHVWTLDTSLPVDQAAPNEVRAPWIGSSQLLAFQVAPGAQRAALVSHDPDTGADHLLLTGIERTPNGRPLELTNPRPIAEKLSSVSQVTWIDQTTLVVLGRTSTEEPVRPFIVDLSGEMTPLQPVNGTRSLTATGDVQGIFVVTDRDKIFTRVAQTWLSAGTGTDLIIPGS